MFNKEDQAYRKVQVLSLNNAGDEVRNKFPRQIWWQVLNIAQDQVEYKIEDQLVNTISGVVINDYIAKHR